MTKNIKITLIFLSLVLFISCNQQVKELLLEDKITVAVASRKIPVPSEQKVNFSSPHWIEGRGPHSTEIFSHLENYIPTILIEKGDTKTKELQENISSTLGQEMLTIKD